MMNGFCIVDKPPGMTSHDVVNIMRRKFNMRRVGHAGTLDPLATGVLIILLGKSTKLFEKFSSFSKAYQATMTLGLTTDTADINGTVVSRQPDVTLTRDDIEKALEKFTGDIKQVPPMVSAVKVNGTRLYALARKGIEVKREPRAVRVDVLRIIDFSPPDVQFYIECSKGTYIRTIADDVGALLGCGACISQIRRVTVGPFILDDALPLERVTPQAVREWK